MLLLLPALLPALLGACGTTVKVGDDREDSASPDTDPVDTVDTDTAPVDTDTAPVDTDTAPIDTDTAPVDTDTGGPVGFAHLPVFLIETKAPIGDTEKSSAFLRVVEDHDGTLTDLDAAPTAFVTAIGIEIHGSSSTSYPKLGYKFECVNAANEDEDCALVGLPEGSDWVLHAPYSDKTLMRNALAYSLGRDVAEAAERWEPRTQFVELVIDGDYRGVYLLVERVSREADRLDIPKTTLEDGTVAGGFIVKADGHRSAGFDTAIGTQIDWATPKADAVTPAEAAYILNWFDTVEAVFVSDGFADPETGYAAWIDVDGWVDHWLLNELTHNIDAYRLSAYLWADGPPGTTPLHAGPLWDFDRAWGNCNYCDAWNTYGYIYDDLDRCGYSYQYPMWWERLREDPAYEARLRARWDELRADLLSDTALHDRIAELKAQLAEAQLRDQARWGTIGVYVDPNYFVGASWDEEVDWLDAWAMDRAAWMDAYLPR